MQETKLYNSKIVDNTISGVTAAGANITRPIVKTEAKDLILTHDFLFRLVSGAVPVPAKPAVSPVVPLVKPVSIPHPTLPAPH